MSLIAVTVTQATDGTFDVRVERDEPCPGASRLVETSEGCVVAWGEPHGLQAATGGACGVLAAASWIRVDRGSGRIDAAVDRFGTFPVLLHRSDHTTVLASHALAMARALGRRAVPDPLALEELLGVGQLLGERSTLRGVRHLPAGARLVLGGAGERLDAAPLRLGVNGPRCTARTAVDAFVASVDRRLRAAPDALVPLSGGLDSRLILAAALAGGHRPECLVYGAADSADVAIARDLAAAAGTVLHIGNLDAASLAAAAPSIAAMGGGAVPLQHGHGLAVPDLVRRTRGRPLLTGTGAETWRAFYWDRGLPGIAMLGRPAWRKAGMRAASRWAGDTLLRRLPAIAAEDRSVADRLRAGVTRMIEDALAGAADVGHGLDALYLGQRVRRFVVAGQQLLDADHARLHPYLDADVVDSWSRLDPGLRLAGRFQRRAIARLAPGLARQRWDRTMRPMTDGLRWHERWPGLADRLGGRGSWSKRGRPIADYAACLGGSGVARHEGQSRWHSLLRDPAAADLRGTLAAWTLWEDASASCRGDADLLPGPVGGPRRAPV